VNERPLSGRDNVPLNSRLWVINDVSVSDWQKRSMTMALGKSRDTHGPVGTWLKLDHEIADPMALDLLVQGWPQRMGPPPRRVAAKQGAKFDIKAFNEVQRMGDMLLTALGAAGHGAGLGRTPLRPHNVIHDRTRFQRRLRASSGGIVLRGATTR
jgi:hypothetical protein